MGRFKVNKIQCPHCHGSRKIDGKPCTFCHGKGYLAKTIPNPVRKIREQAPTNSMGASSSSSGPISTFDPVMPAPMIRRKVSDIVKGKKK